jgi:hypothetical protein
MGGEKKKVKKETFKTGEIQTQLKTLLPQKRL